LSEADWTTDRELTAESAALAIIEHFPDLADADVAALGHGWDFDAYRADDWVFRFPRRRAVSESIDRRIGLGACLEPRFAPLGISVPVVERVGVPGVHFPYRFIGHRWVPGVGVDEAVDGDASEGSVASDLGAVVERLHTLSAGDVCGVRLPSEDEIACTAWLEKVRKIADELRVLLPPDLKACLTWLDRVDEVPPAYDGPPRLLHNDLCPEHVLVNAEGALTGLIDFDDAAWGDPALDFVVLRAAVGRVFFETMLDAYSLSLDPGFEERVTFLARLEALDWIRDAHLQGEGIDRHCRWVRNAFSED
jgi:aminoglycoside phosphotransferase (APT) family kinase protein